MEYSQAVKLLESIGQEHLLLHWNSLSTEERQTLLSDIESLNLPYFQKQSALIRKPMHRELANSWTSFKDFSFSGNASSREKGLKYIGQGKAGCLIVAGGQGTRLGWSGPKGAFPISVIKNKSLFQLFAEKILAASKRAGRKLPLAIMASPCNAEETKRFFAENSFFGLDPGQIDFFVQDTLPFLDDKGNLFLETPSQIAKAPAGNGLALKHFWDCGIGPKWEAQGIEILNYILVDNPLADPYDPELIGFHEQMKDEITIKCVKKTDPYEKVGVLVKDRRGVRVIEYSELSLEEKTDRDPHGELKHACANISLFCFQFAFIKKNLPFFDAMPLHAVKKPAKSLYSKEMGAWKFEFFIFDILPAAKQVHALLYPRERCFSPLKSLTGEGGVKTVRAALQNLDRLTFSEISGIPADLPHPFELAQDFYYPTHSLLTYWKGKPLPDYSYINP